jgi:hypothetical protein
VGETEYGGCFGDRESQQKPALLLSDAGRSAAAANVALWKTITNPVGGRPDESHVTAFETDLFLQLAIQSLLDGLVLAHPSLRKLPTASARALPEKNLAVVAHEDNAHICAITLRIDPVAHEGCFTG